MKLKTLNYFIRKTKRLSKKYNNKTLTKIYWYLESKKMERVFETLSALPIVPIDNLHHDVCDNIDNAIWICWLQGIEKSPEIVRQCISSIHRNSGGRQVVIIDENNFKNYAIISEAIYSKFKMGLIGGAHFSDILRCALLSRHGGTWVDATIYLTRSLSSNFTNRSFYSLRFDVKPKVFAISQGLWVTYLLSCEKSNEYITKIYSMLISYWSNHDVAIDYFLLDYIMRFHFEKNAKIKSMVLLQKINGNERFFLRDNLDAPINNHVRDKVNSDEVGVYKLTYKGNRVSKKGNVPTLYQEIINGYIL
ncbi:capsular polysaccharide synthesis protein [Scandinavium goeteborgense]|uniref:capsular polysaccharide synthesis protein n=1 Tax=Scandinavium goeteborgense TaxID=1851514 RepID=UPI000F6723F8|nr:capsular polysaccharide synthesis protein [Scandinavium goeteborgense]QKN79961.1 hypothetical protein A8O29_001165 [Scandinavium goeteborgense]